MKAIKGGKRKMNEEKYISDYKAIQEKVSSIVLLQEKQIDVAIAIMQEVAKDRRMDEIDKQRNSNGKEPATKKQLDLLKNLGIAFEKGITKEQATKKISEEIEDRKNGKIKK